MQVITPAYHEIVTDNEEWLPHVGGAGILATLASSCLKTNPLHFISGSSFLTGGLAFSAFQIVFKLLDKRAYSLYIAVPCAALATAAFAYMASVPILTALFFAVLGNTEKYAMEVKIFSFLRWSVRQISYGTAAGFIYESFARHLGYRTAIRAGGLAWVIMICVQSLAHKYLSKYLEQIHHPNSEEQRLQQERAQKLGFAVQLVGLAVVIGISPVGAIPNLFMILIANTLHQKTPL